MFSTSYSRVERNKTSICVLYSVGVIQRTEACRRLGRHIIHGALRKLLFQNLTNIHELISCWQLSGGGSEGIERKAKERTGKTEEHWSQRVSYFLSVFRQFRTISDTFIRIRTVPIEFLTVPTDFGLLRPFSDRSVRFQTVPSDLGQLHPFSFRVLSYSDTCVPFNCLCNFTCLFTVDLFIVLLIRFAISGKDDEWNTALSNNKNVTSVISVASTKRKTQVNWS